VLAAEREDYERARGRVTDAQFLDALIKDPAFAWLGEFTALVARLGELQEREIARLLRPDAAGSQFQRRYADMLQRRPEVLVAHGVVMRALKR
jgi:hypothetical protein